MVKLNANLYERLLARSEHGPVTDCIVWHGTIDTGCYGNMSFQGTTRRVHTVA